MDYENYIEVHISGDKESQPLSVDNYDIKELSSFLQNMDGIISNGGRRSSNVILKEITEGSVKLRFRAPKQLLSVFAAVLCSISGNETLDGIESSTAKSIEEIQKESKAKGYTYSFTVSGFESELTISPESNYKRNESQWLEGEFYFYGEIRDAGGKRNPNIHIETKEYGPLKIDASKEYLRNQTRNLLYHTCGVHVKGRQNMVTMEIDRDSLELVEILNYSPIYDSNYLDNLISQTTPILSKIPDKQKWLNELRSR